MIKCIGHADLPLHTGIVPRWLSDRMMRLGTQIAQSIILQYGKAEFLSRLSSPLWFQSFGAVLGMDWHSSGITTSVMYALKRGMNACRKEFGIYICGGRGKYSRQTPTELKEAAEHCLLDPRTFIRDSKLCAKIDSTAVQDGFSLYQHNFILADTGEWAVVQQGMNENTLSARRYHWCSKDLKSFIQEPHTAVTGENQGLILNLTDKAAKKTQDSILSLALSPPQKVIKDIKEIVSYKDKAKDTIQGQLPLFTNENISLSMPRNHEILESDIDTKRLGAVLALAYDSDISSFENLLLTKGLGPRTLQALTLVSEVINGTPSRFLDPARFSFAHGGKDGHPFPVPVKIYDESIRILADAIEKSKLCYNEKSDCLKRLHTSAKQIEANCSPVADFDKTIAHEKAFSKQWGGRTVSDKF